MCSCTCQTALSGPNQTGVAFRRVEGHAFEEVPVDQDVERRLEAAPDRDRNPSLLQTQRLLAHAYAGAVGQVAVAWASGRSTISVEEIIDHLERIFRRISPRAAAAQ